MLAELKQCFMEAYDDNQDGKIDIREVKFAAFNCCCAIHTRHTRTGLLVQSYAKRRSNWGRVGGLFFVSIQPCVHLVENRETSPASL